MHNPYTPPTAQVGDIEVKQGSGVKAVLIGLAVDIGGTILSSTVITIAYGISLVSTGADEEQVVSSIATMPPDSWAYVGAIVAGCLFSLLGGYICARIAKHSEYKLGGILSAISIAIALMVGSGQASTMLYVALAAATVASIMAGVWLGASRNAKDQTRRQQLAQQG